MGLELLDEVDQRGVESTCLRCLAGDVGALCGVEGFGDAVQVQAFLPDFLEEVCDKNGFGHTPGGDEAGVLPMAEGAGCILSRAVPWYASCQGKMSKVGRPATPAFRDHWVGCIVR